jgi:predicted RNA-binding Zn-ribbon protein involved in translation (DUF1610 family)
MVPCSHTTLELVHSRKRTVRCRRCHLTLDAEELLDGHCPECFERSGRRNYEFEEIAVQDDKAARYRCEECGVIIECV